MSIDQNHKQVTESGYNSGSWNKQECLMYLVFLDQNKLVMSSKLKKKKFRVFDQMSEFIKTRTSLQCRSHHQKALEKFKEVKQIILFEKQQQKDFNYKKTFEQLREKAKINFQYQHPSQQKNQNRKIENEEEKQRDNKQFQDYFSPFMTNFVSNDLMVFPTVNYQICPILPLCNGNLIGNWFYFKNNLSG